MNDRTQTLLIARREFLERARSRAFIVTMIVLAVIVIGGMFLVGLLAGSSEASRLGVGGDSPDAIEADIEAAAAAIDEDIVVVTYTSAEAAVAGVESGDVGAALVDGDTIVVNRGVSASTYAIFDAAANATARRDLASDLGLTAEEVSSVVQPVQVGVEQLDPEDADEQARAVASFLAAIVLLTTIMMFGQFVAMGIVEEKQNRVVEIVLARAKTTSLLIGKVLGIGGLGLLQIASLGLAVVIGLALAPLPIEVPDLTRIGVTAVLWLFVWFVMGYLVYSFLYATLGATISRQEDMQSVAFIPAICIMPAYFLVVVSAGDGGSSAIVRIASFVPIWSPIIMPFRINTGDAAAWEIAVAMVITALTVVVLVRIGARIYRGAALRTGARISLKEAWRSAEA